MQKELMIGLAVLALTACTRPEHTQQEQAPLRVSTMVVRPQSDISCARYVGTIVPVHETPLSMQTPGRVIAVLAKNGEYVREGQAILRLDSTQAMNACATAEAALVQAQDGYKRVKQVHSKGAVTDQKMVEIESQLARAKSLHAAARQQLKECTLYAPCEGVLSGLETEVGQSIVPGMRVCAILDVNDFCVKFTVPESEIGKIAISEPSGVSGEVECAAVDAVFPMTISEKSVVANPVTHTYEVKARIQGGSDLLMAGMVGVAKVKKEHVTVEEDAIIIPAHCILLRPEGHTVWLQEEGKAVRRAITIDGYQADGVRVKSGLQPGDSLITEGYQKLYLGCKVNDAE